MSKGRKNEDIENPPNYRTRKKQDEGEIRQEKRKKRRE